MLHLVTDSSLEVPRCEKVKSRLILCNALAASSRCYVSGYKERRIKIPQPDRALAQGVTPSRVLSLWRFSIILAVALAILAPFLLLGIPSGHDFEFHLNSWMEVLGQWKQGVIYPHWASLANFGYGEARFIFYPPFSWTLGAALGAAIPWKLVPAAYICIALTLSGWAMFLLARTFLQPRDALFAAALYAVNPYHLVIVYWRSAFAELLAGALIPLLLLFVWRLREVREEGLKATLVLSVVIAAAWLTNAPSAVMVNYSLAMLVVAIAIAHRSLAILFRGAMAALFGGALAAFYIVPAAYEQKWVQIAQVLSPGVRPEDNFLFTSISDADHNRFNLLISIVAVAEIAILVTAIALFLNRKFASAENVLEQNRSSLGWALIIWTLASSMLMCSLSFGFYHILPELRFIQLPWRWLLCLNASLALLVAMIFRSWFMRAVVCVVMLAVLVVVWHRIQPPWWDTAADIAEMRDNHLDRTGYEGADEYAPTAADPYEVKRNARRATFEGIGVSRIQIHSWSPESKTLTADVTTPGRLILRLFNYPAWKVEVNGRAVESETQDATGQIMIPVQAGENQVRITFVRTVDRTIGGWISLLAAITLVVMFAYG